MGDQVTSRWLETLSDGTEVEIRALVAADVAKQLAFFEVLSSTDLGAELAIAVADAWQRKGVGTLLLAHLIETAKAHGIGKLYLIDRADNAGMHRLPYLNAIEKLNCVYCGYADGLIAYCREIAARTEQYWCPIKHARNVSDVHQRYSRYAEFGDAEPYHEHAAVMRSDLSREGSGEGGASGPRPG